MPKIIRPKTKEEIIKFVKEALLEYREDFIADYMSWLNTEDKAEFFKSIITLPVTAKPIDRRNYYVIYYEKDIMSNYNEDKIIEELSKDYKLDKDIVEDIINDANEQGGLDGILNIIYEELGSFGKTEIGVPCGIWNDYASYFIGFSMSDVEFDIGKEDFRKFVDDVFNYFEKNKIIKDIILDIKKSVDIDSPEYSLSDKMWSVYDTVEVYLRDYYDKDPTYLLWYADITPDLKKFVKFAEDYISGLDTDYWVSMYEPHIEAYLEKSGKNENKKYNKNTKLFEDTRDVIRNLFLNNKYRR